MVKNASEIKKKYPEDVCMLPRISFFFMHLRKVKKALPLYCAFSFNVQWCLKHSVTVI